MTKRSFRSTVAVWVTAAVVVGVGAAVATSPASARTMPAVASGGEIVTWGKGPQASIPPAAQSGAVAIAGGYQHTLALTAHGSVVAWGDNDEGQATVPAAAQSGITAIGAGPTSNHSLAVTTAGAVVAWGSNVIGESVVPVAAQSGVTAVAAGIYHSLALRSDGSVVAWGDPDDSAVPATASNVVAIAAGSNFSLALRSDGAVVAWGSEFYVPAVPAAAQSGVVAIAAGGFYALALKADGSVIAWGHDEGFGVTTVPAAAQSGVVAIAAGQAFALAQKADGTVIAWGDNRGGQTQVPATVQGRVTALTAGYQVAAALLAPPDTTAPVITVPATITTEATGPDGAATTFDVSAVDDVDGTVPVTCDHPSGSVFPLGFTRVNCDAQDSSGNLASAAFTVAVVDTTGPVFDPYPKVITAEATSIRGAVIDYPLPTARDAVDGAATVTCTPPPGSQFRLGGVSVECSSTDRAGNTSRLFLVTSVRDTTGPVLSATPDLVVAQTSSTGAAVTYAPTATDQVEGALPVTCDPASGTIFPVGTSTVTCTASDSEGNTTRQTFTVTVAAPPTITGTPPTGTVGQPYSFTYTTTGNPTGFTTQGGVPGLTFSATDTGLRLSGTPTTAGTFTYTVTATGAGGTTSKTDTITIAPADAAPVVTSQPVSTTVVAGQSVTFTAAASGYPAPTVQWQRSDDGVTWVNVAGATSSSYALTAQPADNGARFRAVFTNRAGTATSSAATLVVQFAPTITGTPPAATAGQSYAFSYATTGNPAPTVTVTSGQLPPGLSLTPTGTLSGTPSKAGTYSFTVTATNNAGTASTSSTLTVAASTTPPGSKADLSVTVSAPGGKAGQTATWTVTVRNAGPAAAVNVYTALLVPKGAGIGASSPTGVKCGQTVTWMTTSIPAGGTVTYTLTVTLPKPGSSLVFAGTGSARTPDPKLLNNLTLTTTKITP